MPGKNFLFEKNSISLNHLKPQSTAFLPQIGLKKGGKKGFLEGLI